MPATETEPKSRTGRANRGAKPGERRGGRPKGGLNKLTKTLKDMILTSLAMAGGERYLLEQATKQPGAYLALVGRVLPLQVKEGGDEPRMPAVVHHRHEPAATHEK